MVASGLGCGVRPFEAFTDAAPPPRRMQAVGVRLGGGVDTFSGRKVLWDDPGRAVGPAGGGVHALVSRLWGRSVSLRGCEPFSELWRFGQRCARSLDRPTKRDPVVGLHDTGPPELPKVVACFSGSSGSCREERVLEGAGRFNQQLSQFSLFPVSANLWEAVA